MDYRFDAAVLGNQNNSGYRFNQKLIKPTLASESEWLFVQEKLRDIKRDMTGPLPSGFKFSRKQYPELKHSFVLFCDEDGSNEKLVCVAKHYYLKKGTAEKVKVAEDAQGNKYALKVLNNRSEIDARERGVLTDLGYLHGLGANKKKGQIDRCYALTELIEGITLEEYLAVYGNDPQMLNSVYLLIHEMAKAINFLHSKNIAHGDLKPRNFTLQFDENRKFIGIAINNFGLPTHMVSPGNNLDVYRDPMALPGNISIAYDLYAFGQILRRDFPFQDNGAYLDNVGKLCAENSSARPSAAQFVAAYGGHTVSAANLPTKKLISRLSCLYQNVILNQYKEEAKHRLMPTLRKLEKNKCFIQDNATGALLIVPNPLAEPGESFDYAEGKKGTVLSLYDYMYLKYKDVPLLDLLKLSRSPLKVYKEKALVELKSLVRQTNNIDELADFFTKLKLQELNQPFLRKERCFLMGSAGMTDSWKAALNLFKERALELAQNDKNLNKCIQNPNKYRPILEERMARIFEFKSTQLCEFEKEVRSALIPS